MGIPQPSFRQHLYKTGKAIYTYFQYRTQKYASD